MSQERLQVRVRSITYQGEYINAYEVVDPDGKELPPFTAGAHIDLYFRDGRIRQYSLCNDPRERARYVFAVQREANGRGGSKAIFELVHVGRILTISHPRNHFPLRDDAAFHLLIAGGIGITPIMAMLHRLHAIGADFMLHYCARDLGKTAFREELAPLAAAGRVAFHHDGGDPRRGLDVTALLAEHRPGTHLYCCGPAGLMTAVERAASHWPAGSVHFEHFAPAGPAQPVPAEILAGPAEASGESAIGVGFRVKLARSGGVYDVPNDKSIVEVLREHGIEVQTSCESGLCGTCRTRYLEGTPEHRDYILDEQERRSDVLICCARSKTPLLVLDL